jgi:hypothetical protein
LSLAAKGKKNIARSLCNFILLSLGVKGKFETGQGRASRAVKIKSKNTSTHRGLHSGLRPRGTH